ncbi:MAG: type II toxin-antitoxin system HicB family antitoxin [Caulobacteraceae bacterium]|nr:type II toxin-antitoxin system HicB family antitoxin [Caulobacteraceae bacterium]
MTHYIALIHKDNESDYGVSFPDFPGCISAGPTLEEARRMGAEALALHIEGMVEDGDAIPEPSGLDAVMHDPDNRDGVAILIPAEVKAKSVRVNVTLPQDALQAIDRYAEAHGLTRSGFLVTAARRMMEHEAA